MSSTWSQRVAKRETFASIAREPQISCPLLARESVCPLHGCSECKVKTGCRPYAQWLQESRPRSIAEILGDTP